MTRPLVLLREVELADDSFLADVLSTVGARLAEEEQPVRSLLKGLQNSLNGERATSDDEELSTPVLDRMRERRQNRNGPLRRLFRGRAP